MVPLKSARLFAPRRDRDHMALCDSAGTYGPMRGDPLKNYNDRAARVCARPFGLFDLVLIERGQQCYSSSAPDSILHRIAIASTSPHRHCGKGPHFAVHVFGRSIFSAYRSSSQSAVMNFELISLSFSNFSTTKLVASDGEVSFD